MPNRMVGADGIMRAGVFNPRLTFAKDGEDIPNDVDGSALVIHSGADDHASQPAGDAGERIACAVIDR